MARICSVSLRNLLQGAMNATPKACQPKLQEAQRAWIKFRDADCGFFADLMATWLRP